MRNKSEISCILCGNKASFFCFIRNRHYYHCNNCFSIILDPGDYVSTQKEKARYETHNNDIYDARYQKFVSPVVNQIFQHHTPEETGLDFGSGTGPVITKLLRDQGFQIRTYDPFFNADMAALELTYHYIACCEVVEHFQNPVAEFRRLRRLLKPGGRLYCMTDLYHSGVTFEKWNYKNDETHVIFYHPRALHWIRENTGFSDLEIVDNRVFILQA